MPVTGLPKILDNSLSNILDELHVTSWNIKSSSEGMQVWIRFSNNMDTETPMTNITYRKAPPSQQKRNKERASDWQNKPNCDMVDGSTDNEIVKSGIDINNTASKLNEECAFNTDTQRSEAKIKTTMRGNRPKQY